ncbi:hypothetical protein RA19_12695 [Leisingera sp. ANG-M1]|uniref:Lrp/AsnC family transcriptional regulator n=1 Tax=Leisingera sp. ANG-M1 TaxID=1577895 RepID=UPI00057F8FF0|nr:Lrp/AsnC family transcriptional regulator [Leisingera sp. ANG-M1]KIC10014.1 hypothetical protein RA19_12695 [Leisingera sp. ANG-M1]
MDETDRELIRLLSRDARRSAAELARELGVSRPTVQNRIDRLRATGVIARFTVELGKEAQTALVDALVLLKLSAGDSRQTVARLTGMAGVEAVSSVNGSYDFAVELRVASLPKLDQLLAEIRRLPMVIETNSSIRLETFK